MTARLFAMALAAAAMVGAAPAVRVPSYAVDPAWPKPLPNQWLLGAVAGVAVDAADHVWVVHRPSTLQPNETRSIWRAAPLVLEFDQQGNLVSSWGGPGEGYEWPDLERGILVDAKHVWLGGGGEKDAQLLSAFGHAGHGAGQFYAPTCRRRIPTATSLSVKPTKGSVSRNSCIAG